MNSVLQNNPFSIYDFLGYLFPGIFFVIVMSILLSTLNISLQTNISLW